MTNRSSALETQSAPPAPASRAIAWRYVVTFALTSGIFFAIYNYPYPAGAAWNFFFAYLRFYAFAAGSVLRIFDSSVHVSGIQIIGRSSLSIVRGCDGAEVTMLFTAAVVSAHSFRWRARLVGVAAGLGLITVVNICRICSLYYVNLYLPSVFELFHLEIWPLVLIALAAGSFVLWIRWARDRAPSHG